MIDLFDITDIKEPLLVVDVVVVQTQGQQQPPSDGAEHVVRDWIFSS